MEIVDIDEMLKDDSFCLMAERSQDDVTNILQQWRSLSFGQGVKCDTRTFTRSKRKIAQIQEPLYFNDLSKSSSTLNSTDSSINLQIGGLVTNISKISLQNVSPPPSVCLSLEERMNNSLITSEDFTNVSFFNTSNFDEATQSNDNLESYIPDTNKVIEHFSLLRDSSLSKDSNVAQTDTSYYFEAFNNDDVSHTTNKIQHSDVISSKQNHDIQKNFNYAGSFDCFRNDSFQENITNVSIDRCGVGSNKKINDFSKTCEKNSGLKNNGMQINGKRSTKEKNSLLTKIPDNFLSHKGQIYSSDPKPERFEIPSDDFKFENHASHLQSTPYQHKSCKRDVHKDLKSFSSSLNKSFNNLLTPLRNECVDSLDSYLAHVTKINEDSVQIGDDLKEKIKSDCKNKNDTESLIQENDDEFDGILQNLETTMFANANEKMRQSVGNIKKRLSLVSEKLPDSLKSTAVNILHSASTERLLTRRSRLYDQVPLTDSIKQKALSSNTDRSQNIISEETFKKKENVNNLQNLDRFKTVLICKHQSDISKGEDNINRNANDVYRRESITYNTSTNTAKERKTIANKHSSKHRDFEENEEICQANKSTNHRFSHTARNISQKCVEMKDQTTFNLDKLCRKNYSVKQLNCDEQQEDKQLCSTQHKNKKSNLEQQRMIRRNTFSMTAGNNLNENARKTFKVPEMSVTSKNRQTGLMRPSSGFYSCSLSKLEDSMGFSVTSKGSAPELNKKYTNNFQDKDCNEKFRHLEKNKNTVSVSAEKSNIPKPSSYKISVKKKSEIPLPAMRR